jgi:predicted N-formylglutamate amidohydrolase
MHERMGTGLLASDEPGAVEVVNETGSSPYVILCDHASNRVPRRLASLGLDRSRLEEHIAWDPGAAAVARRLAATLDATLVSSGYSRLCIDCNRPLESPESIAEASGGVAIPGNRALSAEARSARIESLYRPYHAAIERILDARVERASGLLCIHSFTPVLAGRARPWQIGVAPGHDRRLGEGLAEALASRDPGLAVGLDEPYAIDDAIDYTIPAHGDTRGLPCALVEIRQDEIRCEADAARWADRIARAARQVAAEAGARDERR